MKYNSTNLIHICTIMLNLWHLFYLSQSTKLDQTSPITTFFLKIPLPKANRIYSNIKINTFALPRKRCKISRYSNHIYRQYQNMCTYLICNLLMQTPIPPYCYMQRPRNEERQKSFFEIKCHKHLSQFVSFFLSNP